MIERKQHYIDGRWTDPTSPEVLTVINPATEEAVGVVPRGTAEDVELAVAAAVRAFPAWSRTPVAERIALFGRLARLTEARTEDLARTIVAEVGYPLAAARKAHVEGGVEELDLIAEFLGEIRWREDQEGVAIERVPSGVVGAITAWNAPLRSVVSKAGAAIAAGCTVVLKPSETAPLTALLFAEICDEAGVPPGVFNVVCGLGPEVGEAIAGHPMVDMVSLTGSVRAGRRVMQVAAETIKRVHLELGGKSPNVILEDADFERAVVDGIQDAMRNTGQACGALTRMLVPRARLAEAEALATRAAAGYRMGDPLDPATNLGPLATAAARERVRGYIEQGRQDGLRLLIGGAEAPEGLERGYFVKPTVFSGDNSSRLAREEIFGPVVVIMPFDDEEDAVRIANDTVYGLGGAVWSGDDAKARAIAGRLRAGRVRINGAPLSKRGAHGGFKLSGVGREWGRIGIEEFLEYQSIMG